MARGRHRRRSGLLSRLVPRRRPGRVALLELETTRLRAVALASAETAGAALVRAAAAQDAATAAHVRALLAEAQLTSTRRELGVLRRDVVALREELVWAYAEARVPVGGGVVLDLTEQRSQTGWPSRVS